MQLIANTLKKYWGYDTFRPFQKEIIDNVLQGKDVLAILPTSGGKSLCYQIPTMAKDGFCIVISPLIALMKDQVDSLIQRGIPATFFEATMSQTTIERTLYDCVKDEYRFLYTSPERIQTPLFHKYSSRLSPTLIAIDEAHCISEWGHDFRPQFLNLKKIKELFPKTPIISLTASATPKVQTEIIQSLCLENPIVIQGDFKRPNLSYSVLEEDIKMSRLLKVINHVKGSGIIYCRTRKDTIDLCKRLQANNISSDYYHAGIAYTQRSLKQKAWMKNQIDIMVCTSAFGMGIDKPEVRKVIHYYIPESLEMYYQQAGRAGRDGKKAYAVLLFSNHEIERSEHKIKSSFVKKKQIIELYKTLLKKKHTSSEFNSTLTLNTIAKSIGVETSVLHHALKLMEIMRLVKYKEFFFKSSEIFFLASKSRVRDFLTLYPKYEELCNTIFRSYEGVFDIQTNIDENILSERLNIQKKQCRQMLLELQTHELVQYSSQKEGSLINFLPSNTMNVDFSQRWLWVEHWQKLKLKRWEHMKEYILNTLQCRSSQIEQYFTEYKNENQCGICDNCLKHKKLD